MTPILETKELGVRAGNKRLLEAVNFAVHARQVFGLIGPSGAGKSTVLRCLNRLTELNPGLSWEGDILLHGSSTRTVNADSLRMKIGMLLQQPVIFPVSILKNVLFGVRHHGVVPRREWPAVAETALRAAALWLEVKDRLHTPAVTLSVGQQQRLCLARTLAVNPEIILMDEPTSALDPRAAAAIEDLIFELKARHTIVLVTHNMTQARRLCDRVAFLTAHPDGIGRVICTGSAEDVLARSEVRSMGD